MSDLNEKLQKLHEAVVDLVTDRLENPPEDDLGRAVVSNEDLRVALALLKQNGVTAPVQGDTGISQTAKLAGKLQFEGLKDKRAVVLPFPVKSDPGPSAA
jgi:hypothetical protein